MTAARIKSALEEHASSNESSSVDPVWTSLREAAEDLTRREPALASMAHTVILAHDRFDDVLSFRLAQKLASAEISALALRDLAAESMLDDPEIGQAARADIVAVFERDPACKSYLEPVLYLKGFQALSAYRVAHWFWRQGRREIAGILQMRISEAFGVDIHPGARVGRGVMIDHATGVVIGETAAVGNDVSILQGVTLGGTGKESGDRHPKVGNGVLIGANASILGNIRIGDCSRVGAGSVVLHPVPPCKTVVGVPARIVGDAGCKHPSRTMDHMVDWGQDPLSS